MSKKTMIEEYFNTLTDLKKKRGEETILLWQCGSFFEVYALGIFKNKIAEYHEARFQIETFSNLCNMTIVKKGEQKYKNKPIFMAGFTTSNPHILEKHLNTLMDNGLTVKIVIEDGNDIVSKCKKRRELGIFSPGTNFNNTTTQNTNNIMCIWLEKREKTLLTKQPHMTCGASIIDIFTGNSDFIEFNKNGENLQEISHFDDLDRFYSIHTPKEVIIIHNYEKDKEIDDIIQFCGFHPKKMTKISIFNFNNKESVSELENQAYVFSKQNYQQEILERFYENAKVDYNIFLETTQLTHHPFSLQSFCFLLDYIYCHNPNLIHKIYEPRYNSQTNNLLLMSHALHQLNIIDTYIDDGPYSSVKKILNKCITPMGKRAFDTLLVNPVVDGKYLKKEYNITEFVISNYKKLEHIREKFKMVKDVEKLYRKIILKDVLPCEIAHFYKTIQMVQNLYIELGEIETLNRYIDNNININLNLTCEELMKEIKDNIDVDTAININNKKYDINFITKSSFKKLDHVYDTYQMSLFDLNKIQKCFNDAIRDYQNTGTNFVKYHTTEKSAPYLELTNARSKILEKIIKKQIDNTDNPALGELDLDLRLIKFGSATSGNKKISGIQIKKLCNDILINKTVFHDELRFTYKLILTKLENYELHFKKISQFIKLLDVLMNKAYIAKKNKYCKPKIKKHDSAFFSAKDLRHPLIEKIQTSTLYIPNDVEMGINEKGILLFGTNAVGKSSLIKSIGICIIMAQAGLFVPCSEFIYHPYNKIFTRILGNDNLFKGLSSFQVEMCEFKTIDNLSDENSLILGDELCSGTEMGSAISLFSTGLIRLNKKKSSYIFATHFHELGKMKRIQELEYLSMKHMEVVYDNINDALVYNRKLCEGQGNNMYGLEVCKFLKFDDEFMELAHIIRREEFGENESFTKKKPSKYNNKLKNKCTMCDNKATEVHHMMPQKDADENGYINVFHKNHKANTIPLCKACHLIETKNDTRRKAIKTTNGLIYEII